MAASVIRMPTSSLTPPAGGIPQFQALAILRRSPIWALQPTRLVVRVPHKGTMRDLKQTSFSDRLEAAAEAKKAMLAKFKPKPAVVDPNFESRSVIRAREVEAARAARAVAKEVQRVEQTQAREAAVEEQLNAEEAVLAAKRA